jgi:S1-C subfamily serine protease
MMKRFGIVLSLLLAIAAMASEKVSRPGWLGIGLTHHIKGSEQWLLVRLVLPDGPGAAAGIHPGDVITAIDGKPLRFRDSVEMLELLGRNRPGDRIKVSLMRGQQKTAAVIVTTPMSDEQYARWQLNLEMARKQRAERPANRQPPTDTPLR